MPSPEQPRAPYWQTDRVIGEVPIRGESYPLHLKLHQATERFSRRNALIPLTQDSGSCTYFHAKPYLAVPEFRLTIDLFPSPRASGALGKTGQARQTGTRQVEIGEAQAWYYPVDRVLLLWECSLFDAYRFHDPIQDRALATVWTGVEETLLARVPQAEWLVTTWEDEYERTAWQFFLYRYGYQRFTEGTFVKPLPTAK